MPLPNPIRSLVMALVIALTLLFSAHLVVGAQDADPEQQALGARLFAENCAVCHGPSGEGRVGAELSKDWPSIRPDLTVRSIISNGVPGTAMPAWSQAQGGPLSETEIDALVAHILSWQTGDATAITPGPTNTPLQPITPPPNVQGDPNRGAQLYTQNCAVCHGEQGEGRIGATLAKSWSGVRPDLSIRAAIANGVPGAAMPAWSQANGGPLSDPQIDDIVSYILSWENDAQAQPTVVVSEAPMSDFMRGWGGVIVFIVLLAAVFGGIVWLQRRQSQS